MLSSSAMLKFPRLSLRKLVLLGYVLLTLVLVLSVGQWVEQRELTLKSHDLRQTAEAIALGIRGTISRLDSLPYVAAQHPDVSYLLKNKDSKKLVRVVNQYLSGLQSATEASALFLVDLHGQTIAASNADTPQSFVGQNYRQRPYFEAAIAGRRGGFYGLGLTTGVPGLFIAEPVRDKQKVIGVVVVKISLSLLEDSWSHSQTPLLLQDERGIVFISSVDEWLYHSDTALSAADLKLLTQHGQYGQHKEFPRLPWQWSDTQASDEKVLKTTLNRRSREFLAQLTPIHPLPELSWRLVLTSDMQSIHQSRREAQLITALLATVILLGGLYWRLQEKRIREKQVLAAQKQAEARQREQEQQLQKSARLASVGEIASTLAHELNQPLMALSNFAVAARSLVGTSSEQMLVSALDEIVEQSSRASEIIRRVRSLINPRRSSYEPLFPYGIVMQAVNLVQLELDQHQIAIRFTGADSLPPVRGDRVLLEQVFVNLLQNAVHALQTSPLTQRLIEIESRTLHNGVEISITDNGPGMSEQVIAQIFSPFFSTKPEGLGLGLSICRTILEAHGGHIHAENRKNGGASFTVYLPLQA